MALLNELPEGFRTMSTRFVSRYNTSRYGSVYLDSSVGSMPSVFDSSSERVEKLRQIQGRLRKITSRARRLQAAANKPPRHAGRVPNESTRVLIEAREREITWANARRVLKSYYADRNMQISPKDIQREIETAKRYERAHKRKQLALKQ